MQIDPNLIIFYVNSVEKSANFYADLLGNPPIHVEPSFVLFLLKPGMRLGLWSKESVEPIITNLGVGGELSFGVDREQEIDRLYQELQLKNLPIIQPPTHMDFGYTFVVCDPDGHRLRLFFKTLVN